jgi:hypothetical protein
MITARTWTWVLLVVFVLVSANAQQRASSGPLVLTITTDKNQVAIGDHVRIKTSLANTSDQAIIVEDDGLFPYAVSVVRNDGKAVALTQSGKDLKKDQQWKTMGKFAPIKRSAVTIPPGKTQLGECSVSDWYEMNTIGVYSLQLQLDWKGQRIVSNVVEVTLTQ